MERCTAVPYGGKEKYVFVNFCHKDEYLVFPIVEALARAGYRLWYDGGIVPGEEWAETIADRLNGCGVFMVMHTKAADDSHNCRRETNLALELKKEILCLDLDGSEMSLAQRLQLGAEQWLKAMELSPEEIADEMGRIKMMKGCRGESDGSVRVIPREKPAEDAPAVKLPGTEKPAPVQAEAGKAPEKEEPEEKAPEKDSPVAREKDPGSAEKESAEDGEGASGDKGAQDSPREKADLSETVFIEEEDDPNRTVLMDEQDAPKKAARVPVVIRLATGEAFKGGPVQTVVGREESSADVVIPSPGKSVSRSHFSAVISRGRYYIADMESANGTYVEGEKLDKGGSVETGEMVRVKAADEELIVLFGGEADSFLAGEPIGVLRHAGSGEYKCAGKEPLRLGRMYPWKSGCTSGEAVSREHAVIRRENGGFVLEDDSRNGTTVKRNGKGEKLKKASAPLGDGDALTLARQEFEFTVITYRGE